MFSLNRIQLVGYVTQPIELRKTPGGQSVADLNIATPYSFKAESGEQLTGTGYHSVTAWGGMAEVAAQYLKPGSQVAIVFSNRGSVDGIERALNVHYAIAGSTFLTPTS
ncbi:MAG: single-stranded DNA-binding protein, partial [Patescibacteria group bacterium]